MDKPLQITFDGLEHSDAVEARIRDKARELERFASHLIGCHVIVQAPPGRHHKGNTYSVHVEAHVPNGDIVASRDPGKNHAHEDVYVAIRDSFNAVIRQLEDYTRRQRGRVKRHEAPAYARIIKLFRDDGYGFVELKDGTEIYFHENSVVDAALWNLAVGDEVRVVVSEGEGEKGPQASAVTLVGKRHIVAQPSD